MIDVRTPSPKLEKAVVGVPESKGIELSAVVIAKNEARHIADLAASLRDAVDEMVLLDTGSSDDTVARAEAHGFRVFHRAWTDHFAEARNAALSYARGEWALSIDADERVMAEHGDEIRQLIAILHRHAEGDRADGFWVTLDTFLTDDLDPDATERYQQLRLFRRSRLHYEGRIHEKLHLNEAGRAPLYLRAPSTIRITHLGYTPAIMREKNKLSRNETLIEKALADAVRIETTVTENGPATQVDTASLRFEQARVQMSRSPRLGLELMLNSLRDLPRDDDLHRHGTAMAARALVEQGRADEALPLLERAVPTDEYAPMLSTIKAVALARADRDHEAIGLLTRIEQSQYRNISDIDRLIRLPALKAELLAISGEPRESWRALLDLMSRPGADLMATATGIATRAWRLAVRAGRPDRYLAELSELTADDQFQYVLALLPEEHQRAAAGIRHVLVHGPLTEPDPRLPQFLPRLADFSVGAGLDLARARLDTEPALALGVAAELGRRPDATAAEVDEVHLVWVRALLLLNHVEQAVVLAGRLPANATRPATDERLCSALSRMATELTYAFATS